MPIERTELSAGETTLTATVESPAGGSEHGAVLLSGANHTVSDDAVFDRLVTAAAEAGVQFLRYQTWDDVEELVEKPTAELHAEVDAALDYLRERWCSRITLVDKSAGGGIALEYAPDQADALSDAEVQTDADPATIAPADLSAIDVPVDILQGYEDRLPVASA